MSCAKPLVDAFNRHVTYLRLSVTDRCDLRCTYCMPEQMKFLPRKEVLIMATGGQGEQRAALGRIALGNHDIKLTEGDTVIFSSKIIPGNEAAIGRIMNALSDLGVIIITDRQAHVHVSGHPGRPELEALYTWLRPQILVPVHGEVRHMTEQARLGLSRGIPSAVVQKNGDLVHLAPGKPGKIAEACAFAGSQDTQDGALPLAESVAADFVRPDLSDDASEPLEFVPPALDLYFFVNGCRHRTRLPVITCMSQANNLGVIGSQLSVISKDS